MSTVFRIALACLLLVSAVAMTPTNPVAPRTHDLTAQASPDGWPMNVDRFLAGEYLQKADVMLERRMNDLPALVIRWATHSEFSHAALVYTAPPFDPGLNSTFVIEAGTSGVDLTKLADYVHNSGVSFIAIKRLKKESWFDADRQSRVRGLLLDKIKAHYDYWTILQLAKQLWFGVREKVTSRQSTVKAFRDYDWTPPNQFICSGLVQVGFVEMMVEAIRDNQISPEALRDVVFTRSAERYLPERGRWSDLGDQQKQTAQIFRDLLNDELYSVTPEDLAQTEKLDWLYLIKGKLVYKISSYDDVRRLTN
jgi:hypothetical protein